ncbi:MAG TPA: type IIL restriction-modification enzyme MmeI, partial [Pyrinomonadaceae bacterium]
PTVTEPVTGIQGAKRRESPSANTRSSWFKGNRRTGFVTDTTSHSDIVNFIGRWASSGAAERANYQIFLSELCDVLGGPRPETTRPDEDENVYVFEKSVTSHHGDGTSSTGRIDLYKRGCFGLEAKQGSEQHNQPRPELSA